jgi:hypothetical protein
MTRLIVPVRVAALLSALAAAAACQKPTDPSATIRLDQAVDITANPDPIAADDHTGGRTYRIVRGNNQPDDILAYDWHTVFSANISLNSNADNKDLDITYPVRVVAATLTIKQATGGIVTPPTGSDSEKFEFVITGRHHTLRADGNTEAHVAFGGPIFYGHAASGFNEKADHPGNVFWKQAQLANKVFAALDGTLPDSCLAGSVGS